MKIDRGLIRGYILLLLLLVSWFKNRRSQLWDSSTSHDPVHDVTPVVVSCRTTSVCRRPSASLVVPGSCYLPPPQTTLSLTFCCPACGICDQTALACDVWLCPRWCVDDWVVFWWIRWSGSLAIGYEAVFCSNASRTLPVSFHLLSSVSMYLPHTVVLKRHMHPAAAVREIIIIILYYNSNINDYWGAENDGHEIDWPLCRAWKAGHEIGGPKCGAWNCRTWKWQTKWQDMKMQDMK